MKLAFVIPAYNEEKLIAKCIESVIKEINNSAIDAQIIVVNNASSDKTEQIARSFEGVKVINENKKGLVYARRAGFEATNAELIANIDADTILPAGWIDIVLRNFEKNKNLVALSGPYIYYDLSLWNRFLVRGFYYVAFFAYLLNRFVFRIGSMIQGGNFVIKRSAWEKVGGYDTSITFYGEDTDIAKRLSKVGAVKWTFKLPMLTSGRRLEHEGILQTAGKYVLNYLSVTFFGRPVTKKYTDVRPE